jgi:hypothetical protein
MIWLPFANTKKNLDVLNDQHVFDVVFQGLQCLRHIYAGQLKWRDARAWAAAPAALLLYVHRAEREMVRRGYDPEPRVIRAHVALSDQGYSLAPVPPRWYGEPALHLSHRSHLIRVAPTYYAQRLPFDTPLELPLIWPGERKLG